MRIGNRKIIKRLLPLLLGCVLMYGCGGGGSTRAFERENVDFNFVRKIAVMPFVNNSQDQYAPERVRDIVITEVLSLGIFDVIDKGVVDSALRDEAIEPDRPLDEQTIRRLSKRFGVQAVLLGTIDMAGKGRKGSVSYPELTITMRMVEGQSGLLIWQASGYGSGDSITRRLFGLSAHDDFTVTRDLVTELLYTIPQKTEMVR